LSGNVRVAVVGHVEWIEIAVVERVPLAGEIVHARDSWIGPAGGGAVAAVQMARLAGDCPLITALGEDELGRHAEYHLERLGVRVEAAWREEPQRRAFVHVDASGERTITVVGDRMGPRADDPLPWPELEKAGAVYFTAGDAGALRHARRAGTLVATMRAIDALATAGVTVDVLVSSANDPAERYRPGDIDPPPRLVVRTEGAEGGTMEGADGAVSRWAPAPLPAEPVDTYGAGDTFAAGLTYALAMKLAPGDALAFAARCGAASVTGRGPYGARLPRIGRPM
jgi:ribokinase